MCTASPECEAHITATSSSGRSGSSIAKNDTAPCNGFSQERPNSIRSGSPGERAKPSIRVAHGDVTGVHRLDETVAYHMDELGGSRSSGPKPSDTGPEAPRVSVRRTSG